MEYEFEFQHDSWYIPILLPNTLQWWVYDFGRFFRRVGRHCGVGHVSHLRRRNGRIRGTFPITNDDNILISKFFGILPLTGMYDLSPSLIHKFVRTRDGDDIGSIGKQAGADNDKGK
jgi:hypothetical protein